MKIPFKIKVSGVKAALAVVGAAVKQVSVRVKVTPRAVLLAAALGAACSACATYHPAMICVVTPELGQGVMACVDAAEAKDRSR